MRKTEFLKCLEDLLEQPLGSLSGREELEGLNWDSLKALEFLALVDQLFEGYQLPPDDLVGVTLVEDLVVLLGGRIT